MNTKGSQKRITFFRVLASNTKVIFSFILISIVFIIIVFYSFFTLSSHIATIGQVDKRFKVLNSLRSLESDILASETSQRGYLLTGSQEYLSEYHKFHAKVYIEDLPSLLKLVETSNDQPRDLKIYTSLKENIDQRFLYLQRSINLRNNEGLDEAIEIVKTNEGKKIMDKIKIDIDSLVELESDALARQVKMTQDQDQMRIYIISFGILSVVAIGLWGFFVIINDQVKRRRLEEKLVESEGKYRLIFENIQDVYYRTDMPGNILMISPSVDRYLGVPADQVIGKNVSSFYVNPQDQEKVLQEIKKSGFITDYVIPMWGKDKKIVYASTSAHVLYDENHNPIGTEGIARDVTERKNMEDTLRTRTIEAERLSNLAVNRELKMIELKEEISKLKKNNMQI